MTLEAVLVTRTRPVREDDEPSTADLKLEITYGDTKRGDGTVTQLPSSAWPGSSSSGSSEGAQLEFVPEDLTNKRHALAGFSPFGSGETKEFATWNMGRETFLSSSKLRETCEDDMRGFAERSDHTEGFTLATSMSDGFGGFTSAFMEMLRDEFPKSTLFATGFLQDAASWKRTDSDRSATQRLLNSALTVQHIEELASMLLPLQPPSTWSSEPAWAHHLRSDLPMLETYEQVLSTHLQSANSELREIDGLNSIVSQLNWRGDNKIAHLSGATPLLPPDRLQGPQGQKKLKESYKDFSVFVKPSDEETNATRVEVPETLEPFAQYTVVRGYEGDELESLGTVLEASTTLKEPLMTWVCLPSPYPVLPKSSPIYRGLLPDGRPLVLTLPAHPDPTSYAGLMGLPDPNVQWPTPSSYYVQPRSVPILTTLSTSSEARHLLMHLSLEVKELLRTRSKFLYEYEQGEYGLGKEGLVECKERLETLADNLGGGTEHELDMSSGEEDAVVDDDEDWDL